jgi:hypothetical protein
MTSSNWKPWWEQIAELNTMHEKEEFLRGIGGGKPSNGQNILYALLAGYVGGKVAQRTGKWK